MLQYVNSFACTKNEQSGTVIIRFTQNEPIFVETDDGVETSFKENEIANIVMEEDCAKALFSSITELLEDSPIDED